MDFFYWVAVEELNLSYHDSEALSFKVDVYIHIYIYHIYIYICTSLSLSVSPGNGKLDEVPWQQPRHRGQSSWRNFWV